MARHGRGFPATVIKSRHWGDTVAPTYGVNPAVALTSSTADFTATASDNNGNLLDHFAGVYAAGSTPTAAQVVAGTGTGFVSGNSQLGIASGALATFTQITSLTNGHAYRGAFTVRDVFGNLATVYYLDFWTLVGQASRGEIEAAGYASSLVNPVSITLNSLATRAGVTRDLLTDLHWAWFDQDDAALLTTAIDNGIDGATDAFGNLTITVNNTGLTTGQYGRLVLETADKLSLGIYRVVIP